MTKNQISKNNEILSSFPSIFEESNFSINVNDSILLDSISDNNSNINSINNVYNENKIDFLSFSFNNKKIIDNSKNPFPTPEPFINNVVNNNIDINLRISNNNLKEVQHIKLKNMILRKGKKDIIFKINKDNKSLGRIKKQSNLVGKHNKFGVDNIIRKLKGRFLEKCRIYINKEYKKYLLNKKHDIKKVNDLLQRITPKLSRKIKKEENLKWLKSRLCNVYSENVSQKCSLYGQDHNKKEIEKLFKENEAKNVIEILNKTVKFMLEAFIKNINIPGFETLDNDIDELEKKMKKDGQDNIKEYLSKYRKVAQNFESIYIKKSSRNNK